MNKTIQYIKISEIKPHPLNALIYSDGADKDLLDSIKKIGIMSPIVITKSMLIISGHRRFNAAQMANLEEVPVVFSEVDESDTLAVEELLIEANRQRQKTPEQIAREYTRLKEIESEKAKRRKIEAAKSDTILKSLKKEVQNSAPREETGKSRQIAAQKLGVSYDTAERSAKIIAEIDTMRNQGKTEEAENLRKTLNEKSVNAAWKSLKEKEKKEEPKEEIQDAEEAESTENLKEYDPFLPLAKDSIEIVKLKERMKRIHEGEVKALKQEISELNNQLNEMNKEIFELRLKEKEQLSLATTEKPVQTHEIQEKEIFYSTKQKAKYWYEKDGSDWVVVKLWSNGDKEIKTCGLTSEKEAQKAMKRTISSNCLLRESEIGKAAPGVQISQIQEENQQLKSELEELKKKQASSDESQKLADENKKLTEELASLRNSPNLISEKNLEILKKENFEMGREIMDQKDIINNLRENASPKAKDFQEQEKKIKKLDKENQAIYDEFNKLRNEYDSIKKKNKLLEYKLSMFEEENQRMKKEFTQ